MGYWDQFDLGDYAEDFEKLGIRNLDQLRARAVELERDYGLDGLCQLLGVEYPEQEPAPRPAPRPTPTPAPGSRDDRLRAGENLFGRLGLIALGLLALIIVVMILGVKWGILKSTLTVEFTTERPEWIPVEEAKLVLIDKGEEHTVTTAEFDENGKASVKVKKGSYDSYIILDGWSFWRGTFESDGLSGETVPFNADNLLMRAVIVSFVDESGAPVVPQNPAVGEVDCIFMPYEDNRYILLLENHTGEQTLTFTADGYTGASVTKNWSEERLTELEVVLK